MSAPPEISEQVDRFMAQLASIDEPLARAVLDLHSPDDGFCPSCDGDDFAGYGGEPPDWPCRTVELVAARFDIEVPEGIAAHRAMGDYLRLGMVGAR